MFAVQRSARVSVSVKCLVLVKMYGNNHRTLFVRTIKNNDVRMNEFPLFSLPFSYDCFYFLVYFIY
jgi:hypothetical protein